MKIDFKSELNQLKSVKQNSGEQKNELENI